MTRRFDPISTALIFLGAWLTMSPSSGFSQSDEATRTQPISPANVKRLFVPADRPEDWPQGDWEAIGREDFQKLLAGLKPEKPKPASAKIQLARYRAVFNGKHLTAGRLRAEVRQSAPQRLLSMDSCRLAITSLEWDANGKPTKALWGNAADGRMLLVLPSRPETEPPIDWKLQGEWNASGRQYSNRVEFELSLLPAAINEMELLLPKAWALASSAGSVAGPLPVADGSVFAPMAEGQKERFRLWRISLGSESQARLTLSQAATNAPARPLVLAEADTTYAVQERELQIEARYELEVAYAPISQVVFEVPRRIRIFSVTYGGDANLSWQIRRRGSRQQVVLELADPLLGKSRPIRIQGLGTVPLGRAWTLPFVTCPRASLLRGEVNLTVMSPLEIRSFDARGFRQTAISVEPDASETLTFAQMASDEDASLTAYIGTPAFSATAQIVSELTTGTEEWLMQSEVTWSAQSGSRFIASCEVLPGWEILDVRRAGSNSAPVISDWRISPPRNGRRARLTIEFLEALTPMQNKRVLVFARRLPLSPGQTMSLASLEPLSSKSVEQFLAVRQATNDLLTSASPSENLRYDGRVLPEFVQNSSLASLFEPATSKQSPPFFFSASLTPEPELTINGGESPFHARAESVAEFGDGEIEETLTFTIEPADRPISRFSFLSTELGNGWQWEIVGKPNQNLKSPTKVAAESNGESESWEIQLPAPASKAFEVRAHRSSAFELKNGLVLPFLPAASEFRGEVLLKAGEDASLNVETKHVEKDSDGEMEPIEGTSRWLYQTSEARLTIERRALSDEAPALVGDLALMSLINGYGDSAVHLARFRLAANDWPTPFDFRLPSGTRLIEVRLNDGEVVPQKSDGALRIPALPANQRNEIAVRYESEWSASGVTATCPVPFPETAVSLLDCRWRFALSPDLRLARAQGVRLVSGGLAEPHWTARFFGPFGRGTQEQIFLPWQASVWESLTSSSQASSEAELFADAEFFPKTWTVHEARGLGFDETLELVVWNRSQGTQWAWIALLTSLIFGFVFRLFVWRFRRHAGVAWFLANLLAAGLLPMPWATFAGAALVGTVIAFLFPRQLLFGSRRRRQPGSMFGSTATFHNHSMVGAILFSVGAIGLWSLSSALVPNLVLAQNPANGPEIDPVLGVGADRINVMIPEEDPRKPRLDSAVVYVDRPFLAALRAAQPETPTEVNSLLNRADYELNVDSEGAIEVAASYDVVVLHPDRPATVRLPIDRAFFGGPGHCKVDGVPHPVFRDGETEEYLVELSPKSGKDAASSPAIAEKRNSQPAASKSATRKILLRMHGVATGVAGGGQYSLAIPAVSNSRAKLKLSEAFAVIAIRSDEGESLSDGRSRSFAARIGATSRLNAVWRQEPAALDVAARQKAEVFAWATLHPLRVDWQLRVKSENKNGQTSATWRLPANAVVRNIRAEHLESYHVLRQGGHSRLILEFEEPLAANFSVDVSFMTPRDPGEMTPGGRVRLPALDLFGSGRQANEDTQTDYQIGISSTPELAVGSADPAELAEEGIAIVPPDRFISAFRQSASPTETVRVPQLAFRLPKPGELELPLKARMPSRRVRLAQEGRIRERELEWTLSAEMETSSATAFRHVLEVPAELAIDSISVQEDETERLVRWSRSADRVELVLSDGTTGTQRIELTGRMPIILAPENRIPLPLIGADDAEILDSRLSISLDQNASHHVMLSGIEELPAFETRSIDVDQNGSRLIAGVRLIPGRAEPVLVVTRPVSKPRADRATFVASHNGQARLASLFHFKNLEEATRQTTIRVPVALTREFLVSYAGRPDAIVHYDTITQADQSLHLAFDSKNLIGEAGLIVAAAMEAPSIEGSEIPQIDVVNGQVDQSLLVFTEKFAIQSPDEIQPASPVRIDDFPDWAKPPGWLDARLPELQMVRDPAADLKLLPAPKQDDAEENQANLHTEIWLTKSDRIAGRTTLVFPPENRRSLEWDWPAGTAFAAATLDGETVTATTGNGAETKIFSTPPARDVRPPPQRRTLVVVWSQPRSEPVPRFGQLDFSLPRPRDLELQLNTLDVVPPRQIRLIAERGVEASAQPASAADGFSGELEPADSDGALSFWTMDSRAETALFLSLLVLSLGGIAYWGLRLNTGDWLHRHPAVACSLIGLFWWTCLAGSAIGFAVFAFSPVVGFLEKRTAPAPEPSEANLLPYAEP